MKKLLISLLIMSTLFSGSAMAASNTTTSNIKIRAQQNKKQVIKSNLVFLIYQISNLKMQLQ